MERIINLRKKLHNTPEISMKEKKTKQMLMDFLSMNTTLEIVDMDSWFYAYCKGTNSERAIAFRADYDAVDCGNGKARHLCGHDGHSAILAGFALELEELKPACDVYLIFQPGEETGEGGKLCSQLIDEKNISEIYGLHNIPGVDENTVVLLRDTFACASTGMEIIVSGVASHAAYPEQGKNPAEMIARIVLYLKEYLAESHKGIVLGTVIGIDVGSEAYGVSAGNGVLRLTFRAEHQEEYDMLIDSISDYVYKLSAENKMECNIRLIEEFPATVNTPDVVNKLKNICESIGISTVYAKEPFRWSEDFGYYLKKTKGAYFGIGCGAKHPGLHTDGYEFNDDIIETAIKIYKEIAKALA